VILRRSRYVLLLQKQKFHYSVHKILPSDFTIYLSMVHFNIFFPSVPRVDCLEILFRIQDVPGSIVDSEFTLPEVFFLVWTSQTLQRKFLKQTVIFRIYRSLKGYDFQTVYTIISSENKQECLRCMFRPLPGSSSDVNEYLVSVSELRHLFNTNSYCIYIVILSW
jgi:hypothetical protein